MTNYIFQDLKTNAPNCKLEERLLQGTTNRTFAFTLFDRGKQSLLDSSAEISAIVLYDPKVINGNLVTKGSYVMDKTNPKYNITIRATQIDNDFSIVYVPFVDEYVTFAGNCEFILQIKENGILTYTYGMTYVVDRNDGYFQKSIPNNLPTYQALSDAIKNLVATKANSDLSNVDNNVFKTKALSSGIGKAETGTQIKALLEGLPVGQKLNYNSALDGKPIVLTPETTARGMELLTGNDKLDYSALKNTPTIPTPASISRGMGVLTGNDRLSYSALRDAPTIPDASEFAKTDASNFDEPKLKQKISSLGIGNIETPAQVKSALQGLTGDDRLDSSAIKNLPSSGSSETGLTIKNKLEGLSGDSRLDASAIKNLPSSGGGSETGDTIKTKLESLSGINRLSATAIKDLPTSSNTVKVATQQGDAEYDASKILFPFANGVVNDSGTVTVNTSFIVTDENNEIVPDCSVIEVPTTSLISARQNLGNSNAVVLDFKGISVDSGDGTPVTSTPYISFPDALVTKLDNSGKVAVKTSLQVTSGGTDVVGRAQTIEIPADSGLKVTKIDGADTTAILSATGPKVTVDGGQRVEGVKLIEVPTSGLLIAEADAEDPNELYLSFAGLPTKKLITTPEYKAMELRFPQANVSGTTNGIVTVGTGHTIVNDTDELSSTITKWQFPPDSNMTVELDPNNLDSVIVKANTSNGIAVAKDDTTPIEQVNTLYFPDANIVDGSTSGSKVISTRTVPVIKTTSGDITDYKAINLDQTHFIASKNGDDVDLSFNGISVETGSVETPAVKVINFNENDFSVDGSVSNIADIALKNRSNNGFLAVYSHRQVIASANAQEVYRTTTLKPNHIIWKDDSVAYDPTTGLINLKYTGKDGAKQLFKLIARATVRRQVRDADLGAYLYFVNNATGDYITDVNGETPIVNKTIEKNYVSDYIELATIISITEDTTIKAIFKDDTPNKFVDVLDLAMGTSAILVEKIDSDNKPSIALINYEILTQQSMRFIKHEFGQKFETASALISNTPNGNISMTDGMNVQQDGWIINFQEEGLYKVNTTPDGTTDCFQLEDKLAGFGYFNITRVLDYEDTWALRGHEVTAKVDRVEQTGEFAIVPVVWRRKMNEYPMVIITGMNNQGLYSTTDGWEVIDASKTVIAAPTPAETTASFTCTYTVPEDAVNVGFMLMPTKQQTRSIIKFTDFALGCDPTFERWIVKYPEQAYEGQLKRDSKYVKFVQYNTTPYNMSQWYQIPNGTQGDNNYSPLYTGEAQSGGNADIQRIYDSSSSDFQELHNKGKWRFKKDGSVTVHIRVPVGTDKFADGSDHNSFRIAFVKDTAGGNILQGTPVAQSLREINLRKSGNVWNDSARTSGYANYNFTMDVKENEEYWLAINPINVPRESGNEGHIYSYPSGYVEFTFLENEYAINLLKAQVESLNSIIKATADAISNKAYIELGYDSAQSKPTLEAKVATTI